MGLASPAGVSSTAVRWRRVFVMTTLGDHLVMPLPSIQYQDATIFQANETWRADAQPLA